MGATAVVTAFNTKIEADTAVARLAAAGIAAFVQADNLGGTFPSMQMTTGGFKVFVRTEDRQRAKDVLTKHYQPIESRPRAEVSRMNEVGRALSRPRDQRIRVIVVGLVILLVVILFITDAADLF